MQHQHCSHVTSTSLVTQHKLHFNKTWFSEPCPSQWCFHVKLQWLCTREACRLRKVQEHFFCVCQTGFLWSVLCRCSANKLHHNQNFFQTSNFVVCWYALLSDHSRFKHQTQCNSATSFEGDSWRMLSLTMDLNTTHLRHQSNTKLSQHHVEKGKGKCDRRGRSCFLQYNCASTRLICAGVWIFLNKALILSEDTKFSKSQPTIFQTEFCSTVNSFGNVWKFHYNVCYNWHKKRLYLLAKSQILHTIRGYTGNQTGSIVPNWKLS